MRGFGVRGAGAVGALWLLLQVPACASDLRLEEGRFRHAELGYSLLDPRALAPEADWRRVELEGATLAFRGKEGTAAAFVVSCGRSTRADARALSRQLLFSLEERRVVEEETLSLEGGRAVRRVVRARNDGAPVRLETLTRVEGDCTYDWVLVTPGPPGPAREPFEQWWRSFRPREGAGEGGAEPVG